MPFIADTKTWKLSSGNTYGILKYNYSSGLWSLIVTDNTFTPIVITSVTEGLLALLSEARVILASEIASASPTFEQDILDRVLFIDDTTRIDFIDADAVTVWNITELIEPEHFQAIKALIKEYLNNISNYTR